MAHKRRKQARVVQQAFEFPDKDGRRHRPGRPRSNQRGVSHAQRVEFSANSPLHVTLKILEGLPSMRSRPAFDAVLCAFAGGKLGAGGKAGFRLTHYSVLGNHMHLMVEADSRDHLASGMCGLMIRIARALNKVWSRGGTVFKDRYHAESLDSPSRVRNALNYIIHNGRKHGIAGLERWFDPRSSARWFDGFEDTIPDTRWPPALARAESWLLREGWKRCGLLTMVPPLQPGSIVPASTSVLAPQVRRASPRLPAPVHS